MVILCPIWPFVLTQKDPLPAICYLLLHLRYLSQIEDIYYLEVKNQQKGDGIDQRGRKLKKKLLNQR